jgi:hypothetical protein
MALWSRSEESKLKLEAEIKLESEKRRYFLQDLATLSLFSAITSVGLRIEGSKHQCPAPFQLQTLNNQFDGLIGELINQFVGMNELLLQARKANSHAELQKLFEAGNTAMPKLVQNMQSLLKKDGQTDIARNCEDLVAQLKGLLEVEAGLLVSYADESLRKQDKKGVKYFGFPRFQILKINGERTAAVGSSQVALFSVSPLKGSLPEEVTEPSKWRWPTITAVGGLFLLPRRPLSTSQCVETGFFVDDGKLALAARVLNRWVNEKKGDAALLLSQMKLPTVSEETLLDLALAYRLASQKVEQSPYIRAVKSDLARLFQNDPTTSAAVHTHIAQVLETFQMTKFPQLLLASVLEGSDFNETQVSPLAPALACGWITKELMPKSIGGKRHPDDIQAIRSLCASPDALLSRIRSLQEKHQKCALSEEIGVMESGPLSVPIPSFFGWYTSGPSLAAQITSDLFTMAITSTFVYKSVQRLRSRQNAGEDSQIVDKKI